MERERGKIERGDRMFAEMTCGGRMVAEFTNNTAVGSMAEVFSLLFQKAAWCKGIVSVTVSNRTRGWTENLAVVLGKVASHSAQMSHKEMIAAGLMERSGQLCIPFN